MKIVLTGSSTGIGAYLKEKLLTKHHEIWGLARSEQSSLPHFHPIKCDVGDWNQITSTTQQIARETTYLDAIICCAGTQGSIGPSMQVDPLHWKRTVEINLMGTFYCIRAFWNLMQNSSQRTKIICFSGGGATSPRPNFSAYGVSKTAVVRLVETLAIEWKDFPIDINAIAPGAINTRLTEEVITSGPELAGIEEYRRAVQQKKSGGASLEKVFDLVELLLSKKTDGLSGKIISAAWDPFSNLPDIKNELIETDIYTLRRILPTDRSKN